MTGQPRPALSATSSPNNVVDIAGFGNLWASVLVYRGEDVEHGEDTCDGETQHPDCKVTSGANPVA